MRRGWLVLALFAACTGLVTPDRPPFTADTEPSTTVQLIPTSTVTAASTTASTLAPVATTGLPVVTAVTVAPPLVTAVATTTSTTLPTVTVVPTSPPITITPDLPVVFSAPAEALLVASTNLVRASVGLSALLPHADLDFYARVWAGHLSTVGELGHSDIGTLLGPWLIVGENVAAGTDMTQVAVALEASPDHYATMVDPAYVHTGVGVAVDPAGLLWVCQVFGGTVLP